MEKYKVRFLNEYKELVERYNKLRMMLHSYHEGTLDFTPACPVEVLLEQRDVMREYIRILETRAEIEKVELV